MKNIKPPLISIVIPTFNHGDFLERAIRSILNQTFENWEAIIIDNHSTDKTDEILASFNDSRIKYKKIHNKGVIAVSRNTAIKIASFNSKRQFLKKINIKNDLLNFDLCNFFKVNNVIKKNKYDIIFNLAAQPSAPYSIISADHCNFTQNNNNQILRNLIWALKNNNLEKTCFF